MKIFSNKSPIWVVIVIAALLFLVMQLLYVDHDYKKGTEKSEFPEQTIFFTVKEHQFTLRNEGFDTLSESLKLWDYDKKNRIVHLREENLLPSVQTPLLVIYDKGYSKYKKQESIVPISSFPFSLKENDSSLQINQVDKDGNVYFEYRDRHISLGINETYRLPYFEGTQLKMVVIKNNGLFGAEQFIVEKKGTYKGKLKENKDFIKIEVAENQIDTVYIGKKNIEGIKKGDSVEYSFFNEKTDEGIIRKSLKSIEKKTK